MVKNLCEENANSKVIIIIVITIIDDDDYNDLYYDDYRFVVLILSPNLDTVYLKMLW
jgi:hypothetical protein